MFDKEPTGSGEFGSRHPGVSRLRFDLSPGEGVHEAGEVAGVRGRYDHAAAVIFQRSRLRGEDHVNVEFALCAGGKTPFSGVRPEFRSLEHDFRRRWLVAEDPLEIVQPPDLPCGVPSQKGAPMFVVHDLRQTRMRFGTEKRKESLTQRFSLLRFGVGYLPQRPGVEKHDASHLRRRVSEKPPGKARRKAAFRHQDRA